MVVMHSKRGKNNEDSSPSKKKKTTNTPPCFLVEFVVNTTVRIQEPWPVAYLNNITKNVVDTVYPCSWLLLNIWSCTSNLTNGNVQYLSRFMTQKKLSWSWSEHAELLFSDSIWQLSIFFHGACGIDFASLWPDLPFRSCVKSGVIQNLKDTCFIFKFGHQHASNHVVRDYCLMGQAIKVWNDLAFDQSRIGHAHISCWP